MHNELTALATTGMLVSMIVQWLKNRSWFPWLSSQTAQANRIVVAALAALSTLGIHAEFMAETGVLTVTGLTLGTIFEGVRDYAVAWGASKGYYKLLLKPNGR